jgi:hypothetical protein
LDRLSRARSWACLSGFMAGANNEQRENLRALSELVANPLKPRASAPPAVCSVTNLLHHVQDCKMRCFNAGLRHSRR